MSGRENNAVASYLNWWTAAGLVDPVADMPHDWRQSAYPPARAPAASMLAESRAVFAAATPAPALETPMTTAISGWPDTVSAFDAWVAADPALPGGDWSRRIAPIGPANAPLMIVSDLPDAEDLASGQLLSGPVGALFDAMLAAIGHQRDGLRIASIAATRPPGGQWDADAGQRLRALALHNIAISNPRAILLLGQSTCQLLTGVDVPADGDGLRNINHYGVTTAAVAIHHPRLLLNRAALKRGAWTALKCLREPA